jgi:hypothetical protein
VLWLLAINAIMASDVKHMEADILRNLLLSIDHKPWNLQSPFIFKLSTSLNFIRIATVLLAYFPTGRECHRNLPNTDARKQWRKEEVVSWGNDRGLGRKRVGLHIA